jgi:hypothetical protein
MRTAVQIGNFLLMLLFVFAAVLQYNDDDMLRWAAVYLVAAGCCVAAMVDKLKWWVPALVAVICTGWASIYAADGVWATPFSETFAEWEARSPRVIETRDMFGLGLIALWMILLTVNARRKPREIGGL